jgi:peptidylprolyl isomerase
MRQFLFIIISISVFALINCTDKQNIEITETGIMYLDRNIGEGEAVKKGDLISIHFRGWIIQDSSDYFSDWVSDTTKMNYLIADSYLQRKEAKFILGDSPFIKGSVEGILGMKSGGKRIIVVPAELAYGQQGAGPIPPNTDLRVFVELLSISESVSVEMWDIADKKILETDTGLKYVILEKGDGINPENGNVVTVHYSGYFEDGTKFDSSVERNEPYSFVVGNKQVIPGWDEGIRLLKKGGKVRLIIPPYLAYGSAEVGSIPPNSTITFDVELVEIK